MATVSPTLMQENTSYLTGGCFKNSTAMRNTHKKGIKIRANNKQGTAQRKCCRYTQLSFLRSPISLAEI